MLRITRYNFTLSEHITLGEPQRIRLIGSPDVNLSVVSTRWNAPAEKFLLVSTIEIDRRIIPLTLTEGDAFASNYADLLKMASAHILTPMMKVIVTGEYTGLVPPGFTSLTRVPASLTFNGEASFSYR